MFDERTAGASLRVEDRGRRVVRDMDSFCNGVVFSRTRLEVGAMYSLEVSTGGDWSGALRLGVTTVPHSRRPQPPPRSVSANISLHDLTVFCAPWSDTWQTGQRSVCFLPFPSPSWLFC